MNILRAVVMSVGVLLTLPSGAVGDSELVQVTRERFTYFFSDARFVEDADRQLERTWNLLYQLVGDTLTYRPAIYIVDNLYHFDELIGGKFPDWGAAAAFPERRLIAIKSPDRFNINRSLDELLAHEYTHLLLAQKAGLNSIPRWLDEGLAMYVSMEWSWSDNLALSKAAVFDQLVSLAEITHVNRFKEGKAHVAYAESYLAVSYLIETYDPDVIRILLAGLASGAPENEAMYQATGLTLGEFEADFRLHLNRRFNIASLFMDTIFFWLGLSLLVIIGAILKFRRKREYYRKWERQERLASTDFDYGDPDRPEQTDDDDEPWRA